MSKKTNVKKIAAVAMVATMTTQNIQPLFALEKANDNLKAKDLIISEYIEGSSNNKAIEIYNGTGETIDLSSYNLELYVNGQTEVKNKQSLSGTLEHNKTYVLVNPLANNTLKEKGNIESQVTNFNGDDVILLKKGNDVIDSFGKLGEDPGDEWKSNGISTKDMTLIRKSSITEGDTNPSDVFDVSVEWEARPKDNMDDLGNHLMDINAEPDTEAPVINIEHVAEHNIAKDYVITAKISDNRKIEYARAYYRAVGETEFKEILLNKKDDFYVAEISKANLNIKGLEYYIEVSDGTNVATSPADKTNPYKVVINDRDIEAPVVSKVYPSHNYNTGSELKPVIGADFRDNTGVDKDSIKLYLDGNDITEKAIITENSIRYTPETDLVEGNHTVKLTLNDTVSEENSTTKEWKFYAGKEETDLYFGQLHAHTNFSDGQGTVDEAYTYAKNEAKVDFLAITDHSNSFDNENLASMANGDASEEWKAGQASANKHTKDGEFVGMFGYEMSWSGSTGGYGHMNTFNTPGFESRLNSKMDLKTYYETLKTQPQSISMFNHPGKTFGDFSGFAHYDEEIDELITLIEVGNGEGAVGSAGYFPSYDEYIKALDKGWHIAPTNGQDNHKGKWGNSNTTRTVVESGSLTRESLYQSMRDRRVYATEDENLEISYKINGSTMGSILEDTDNLNFEINVNDPDTKDSIKNIEIVANGGKVVKTINNVENNKTIKFSMPSDYSYYFVRVNQIDKEIAVTAPIWVGETTKVGINSANINTALALTGEEVTVSTQLYNNENTLASNVKVEYFLNNDENKIGEVKVGDMQPTTTKDVEFKYTLDAVGKFDIIIKTTMTVDGIDRIVTEKVSVVVKDESQVSKVMIDGSKQNYYVSGDYAGKMTEITKLVTENGGKAIINDKELTDELLDGVSLLFISDAQSFSKSATTSTPELKPQNYSQEELEVIKRYVEKGGNLVVTGRADYKDSDIDEYQNSVQGNSILKTIGSSLRFNDDQMDDTVENGGQTYRLYLDDYNKDSRFLKEINLEEETYSFYSGCTVYVDNKSKNKDNIDIIVKGHETTIGKDTDSKGDAVELQPGEVIALASETLPGGGTVIVGGTTFFSDFEVGSAQYSNDDIVKNILSILAPKPELPISTIAEVRKDANNDNVPDNIGKPYAVEGIVTVATNAAAPKNSFFDCMYVQDETGGITVFGISEQAIKVGQKVRIEGVVDEYLGDTELSLSNEYTDVKVIDESINLVSPKKLSTKESMLESNEGLLVEIVGEVTKIEGQNIFVNDGTGEARAFVEGYIGSSSGDTTKWQDKIKVGDNVSIVGMASEDGEDFKKRLRVRDTDEITVKEVVQETPEVNKPGQEGIDKPEIDRPSDEENNKGEVTKPESTKPQATPEKDDNKDIPKTGDAGILGYVGLGITAMAGMVVNRFRKRK